LSAGVCITSAAGTRDDRTGVRTATVATHDLDTTVSGVATIEPVSQAAVAFTDGGTVAAVDVAVGAHVAAGQPLATLDTTQLQSQLHDKQEALTQAQLILSKALDGEDVSALLRSAGGGVGMTRGIAMTSALTVQPTFTLVSAVGSDDITAAQQAVLAGQQRVDQTRSAAAAALDSATNVCAAVGVDVDPSDPAGTTSTIQACQAALQQVVDAQGEVADAQQQLASAASKLDDLLDQYAGDLQSTPTTEPPTTSDAPTTTTAPGDATTTTAPPTTNPDETTTAPAEEPSATGPTGGATGRGGGGGGGSFPSGRSSTGGGSAGAGGATVSSPRSEELISYQKAVDSAYADLLATQQDIARATIASPIDGTVIAVDLAVGDEVSAGSTTQRVLVQGAGGYEATVSLALDDIADVQVGQAATLVPDGAATPIQGTVVAIAAQPDAGSSPTTYRVTVALAGDTSALRNGALGSLSIVTATATDALAVPSSAVSIVGGRHVVRVVDGSTITETRVEVGVVGATWTQITNGLTAGQQVVIADLDEPLPSSATTASQTTTRAVQRTFGGGFLRPGG
jgi:trimeric autotransporter adhesin